MSSLPLSSASDLTTVDVIFTTRLSSYSSLVPPSSFSVPTDLTRYGLSEIVNTLLQLDPPKPFDFLVNGVFLRSSLLRFLHRHSLSGEGGLTLEFIEALPEPEDLPAVEHPDWISSVCGLHPDFILTGCYDGEIRLFRSSDPSKPIRALPAAHQSAVKAVKFLTDNSGNHQIISAGKDRSIKVQSMNSEGEVSLLAEVVANSAAAPQDSVQAIAALQGTNKFVTAGWDKAIALWDLESIDPNSTAAQPVNPALDSSASAAASKKKQRVSSKAASATPARQLVPQAIFDGHSQPVTAVEFPFPSVLYSGSYDQSIKLWDLTSQTALSTLHSPSVVTSLSFNSYSNLLVSGHSDRLVRMWDPRQSGREVVKLTLKSHQNWVSCVSWSTEFPHFFISSSYDQTVKLWDIRAKLPLNTLKSHTDKVLACDFNGEDRIASGGADRKLRVAKLTLKRGENAMEDEAPEEAAAEEEDQDRDQEEAKAAVQIGAQRKSARKVKATAK